MGSIQQTTQLGTQAHSSGMKTRYFLCVIQAFTYRFARSETDQTSKFTPVVLEGGFLPSPRFLFYPQNYEAINEVGEEERDTIEGAKYTAYKNIVPKTDSTQEDVSKLAKYKDFIEKASKTNTPKTISDNMVVEVASKPIESDYANPEDPPGPEIEVSEKNKPTVSVYSRPLLPLPRDFGFRHSEVLDLEQRVTEANFPTISTFTENFEDDIDWSKGKSRVKRSEEAPQSLPALEKFKVGKWKIKSQSLDGKDLNVQEWIVPKDVPKEESIKHHGPYDMLSDLVKKGIVDFGQENSKNTFNAKKVEPIKVHNPERERHYITSFEEKLNNYNYDQPRVKPIKMHKPESERHSLTSFEEKLNNYNYDHPRENKYIPSKSFEEIVNSYVTENPVKKREEVPIQSFPIKNQPLQSFHNFLLESSQKPRHGKLQTPNILNAFQLENPSAASAGRGYVLPEQRRHFYPLPDAQPAENSYRNHAAHSMTDYTHDDTQVPWQQEGQASRLHYTVAERRILNTEDFEENPLRFKSRVVLVNNGTGPQVIIVPNDEGLEDIRLNNGQTIQSALQETDHKTQNLVDLLDTISGGDDDVVRVKDESFFIKDEYFSDKNFLKDMLEDLNSEAQLKKLNLLKESLTQKNALVQADRLNEANTRLTNVGISLHKQGQVLKHVRQQTDNFADDTQAIARPDRSESTVSKGADSDRALTLLRRRKRLESILNKLSYLVERKNDLKPLQQTIRLQEDQLSYS